MMHLFRKHMKPLLWGFILAASLPLLGYGVMGSMQTGTGNRRIGTILGEEVRQKDLDRFGRTLAKTDPTVALDLLGVDPPPIPWQLQFQLRQDPETRNRLIQEWYQQAQDLVIHTIRTNARALFDAYARVLLADAYGPPVGDRDDHEALIRGYQRYRQQFVTNAAPSSLASAYGRYRETAGLRRAAYVRFAPETFEDRVPDDLLAPETLEAFYEQHKDAVPTDTEPGYAEPERIGIEYLWAGREAFAERIEPTEEELRAHFEAHPERWTLPEPEEEEIEPGTGDEDDPALEGEEESAPAENGEVEGEPEESVDTPEPGEGTEPTEEPEAPEEPSGPAFEEVRDRVEEDFREERARVAVDEAAEKGLRFLQRGNPFAEVAERFGLDRGQLGPFSQEDLGEIETPPGIAEVGRQLFAADPTDLPDRIRLDKGILLFRVTERAEREARPYEEVAERVRADRIRLWAWERAQEAAQSFVERARTDGFNAALVETRTEVDTPPDERSGEEDPENAVEEGTEEAPYEPTILDPHPRLPVYESDWIASDDTEIPGIGELPPLTRALFALPLPIEGTGGESREVGGPVVDEPGRVAYVLRVLDVEFPDPAEFADKRTESESVLRGRLQRAFDRAFEARLRKEARFDPEEN